MTTPFDLHSHLDGKVECLKHTGRLLTLESATAQADSERANVFCGLSRGSTGTRAPTRMACFACHTGPKDWGVADPIRRPMRIPRTPRKERGRRKAALRPTASCWRLWVDLFHNPEKTGCIPPMPKIGGAAPAAPGPCNKPRVAVTRSMARPVTKSAPVQHSPQRTVHPSARLCRHRPPDAFPRRPEGRNRHRMPGIRRTGPASSRGGRRRARSSRPPGDGGTAPAQGIPPARIPGARAGRIGVSAPRGGRWSTRTYWWSATAG